MSEPTLSLADCPDCRGVGKLVLFTSSGPCGLCHGRGLVVKLDGVMQAVTPDPARPDYFTLELPDGSTRAIWICGP